MSLRSGCWSVDALDASRVEFYFDLFVRNRAGWVFDPENIAALGLEMGEQKCQISERTEHESAAYSPGLRSLSAWSRLQVNACRSFRCRKICHSILPSSERYKCLSLSQLGYGDTGPFQSHKFSSRSSAAISSQRRFRSRPSRAIHNRSRSASATSAAAARMSANRPSRMIVAPPIIERPGGKRRSRPRWAGVLELISFVTVRPFHFADCSRRM